MAAKKKSSSKKPSLPERVKQIRALEAKIKKCVKCDLAEGRRNVVPGEGGFAKEVMFIGEGPGEKEDELARPFVGAAGKFLEEMLEDVNWTRDDVYITNVVKCRPPGNRDPLPAEVKACWPWLKKQVATLQPKVIVLLGRHSMERFLPGLKISQAHGQPKRHDGQIYFPMYHPAAALYQGSLRDTLKKDFRKIPKLLKMIDQGKLPEPKPEDRTAQKPKGPTKSSVDPKPKQNSLGL